MMRRDHVILAWSGIFREEAPCGPLWGATTPGGITSMGSHADRPTTRCWIVALKRCPFFSLFRRDERRDWWVMLTCRLWLVWSLMMAVSFLIGCMASFLIAHARFLFACTIVAPCMEGGLVARFHVILDILSSFQKKEWRLVYNQSFVYIVLI